MADPENNPISPVTDGNRPELTLSAASIEVNQEPVELDSTPASPEQLLARRRGSKANALTQLSPEDQEKREKLMAERQGDAAVVVEVAQTPSAEEFGKSEDAEAKISSKRAKSSSA